MSFWGIDEYHAAVRVKIAKHEPGWAQSEVDGVLFSHHPARGFTSAEPVHKALDEPRAREVYDKMLVDVARGEGLASPKSFCRDYVKRLIKGLRVFPDCRTDKQRRADMLQGFYFEGSGQALLHKPR